jgi:hypothetical protein
VHVFVLRVLGEHKLIKGTTVGVDSTVLEANAAMNRHGRRVVVTTRSQCGPLSWTTQMFGAGLAGLSVRIVAKIGSSASGVWRLRTAWRLRRQPI